MEKLPQSTLYGLTLFTQQAIREHLYIVNYLAF